MNIIIRQIHSSIIFLVRQLIHMVSVSRGQPRENSTRKHLQSPEITETIIVAVDTTNVVETEMDIIGAVIEADITIEVAEDITVVMDKVATVATGVKVMTIADSKMETTLGATGNAVTGIRTVVADDLTMEIGEVVAKIIAVDGKINQETVKMVINQDKIEIIET